MTDELLGEFSSGGSGLRMGCLMGIEYMSLKVSMAALARHNAAARQLPLSGTRQVK